MVTSPPVGEILSSWYLLNTASILWLEYANKPCDLKCVEHWREELIEEEAVIMG